MLRLTDNQEQNRIVFLETLERKLLVLKSYLPSGLMSHPHHLHHVEVAAVVVADLAAAEAAAEEVGFLLTQVVVEEHLLTPLHSAELDHILIRTIRSNTNPISSSGGRIREYNQLCGRGSDPLAQTFRVTDDTGIFVTSVDVYFSSVDDTGLPVIAELRTVENGIPTENIMPFAVQSLDPEEIVTSSDGSIATNIKFASPVYLEPEKEYAVVLLSDSPKYNVYISRVGENDLTTDVFRQSATNLWFTL